MSIEEIKELLIQAEVGISEYRDEREGEFNPWMNTINEIHRNISESITLLGRG